MASLAAGLLAGCGSSTPVAAGPLTISVHLDRTSVPAGTAINSQVILTNNTSKVIVIHACPGDLAMVGLTNSTVPYDPAIPTNLCVGSIRLKPGAHRFPVTVETFYTNCTVRPSSGRPLCTTFGIPALPAGDYWTKVVTSGLPSTSTGAKPVSVSVTTPVASVPRSVPHGTVAVTATYCSAIALGPPRVSVAIWHNHDLLGIVTGDGRTPFVFRLVPGRYIVRTSARMQGAADVHVGSNVHLNLTRTCI